MTQIQIAPEKSRLGGYTKNEFKGLAPTIYLKLGVINSRDLKGMQDQMLSPSFV